MEAGAFRDDHGVIVVNEAMADLLAERMVRRFFQLKHNLDAQGKRNPRTQNQWGGKGVIKFNPTTNEIALGITQQKSLFVWQSEDQLPHYVTVEVGRVANGVGGPGADTGTILPGHFPVSNGVSQGGAGTFPAPQDSAGNPLYYRATAQVTIGTPGAMQDPFWIDINRGQRFTALASYVALTAQMSSLPINEQTGNTLVPPTSTLPYISGSLPVYGTIGAHVAPSLAPVLYTQYIDNDLRSPQTTAKYFRLIPPRANFLYPVMSVVDGGGNTIFLTFFDVDGTILGQTQFVATSAFAPPIAIPPDAYIVQVNEGGFGLTRGYRLIYQLSV